MGKPLQNRRRVIAGFVAFLVVAGGLAAHVSGTLDDQPADTCLNRQMRLVLEGKAILTPEQQARGKELFDQARELDAIRSQPPFVERKQARALYEQALCLGYEPAVGEVGMSYLDPHAGEVCPQDALLLFRIGIGKGDTVAMRGQALFHRYGVPGLVEQDHDASVVLYRQAAELGDVRAQFLLGVYLLGRNRDLDPGKKWILPYNKIKEEEGVFWSLKAAESGESRAFETLSSFYLLTKCDVKQALYYAREGARRGNQSCLFKLYQGHRAESPYLADNPKLSMCYKDLYDRAARSNQKSPFPIWMNDARRTCNRIRSGKNVPGRAKAGAYRFGFFGLNY